MLGLFDLFRKKSEEELFAEAVRERDYTTIERVGKSLLERDPDRISVLNPYVDALEKLGKKEEAASVLISFAERKLQEEYYDVVIPVLKRVLKIDPLNLRAVRLLVNAFKKKELYYEAFSVLLDTFRNVEKTSTPAVIGMIEDFLKDVFHPVFYEKYGDVLLEKGREEDALTNYILAGNMYINLGNYKSAFKAFLKARKIKATEVLDNHLVETLSHLDDQKVDSVLVTLLQEHQNNLDFITFTVSQFRETQKLGYLKTVAERIHVPRLKYTLLALINYEQGEVEEGQEYLNKLRILDSNLYETVVARLRATRVGVELPISIETRDSKELPEPEQVLEVLEDALDLSDLVNEYLREEKQEDLQRLKQEVTSLKRHMDGSRLLSTAEALLGIGNLEKAEEAAREALDTEYRLKAAILLAEILRQRNRERDAISFLLEEIRNGGYSEEEKAKLKVKLGEIYQSAGDVERSLYWFRDAQQVLRDKNLQEKIAEIEREAV